MFNRTLNSSRLIFMALSMVFAAACSPSYINKIDLGPAATSDEITRYFSGNSIKVPRGEGSTEVYFAPDGSYKAVASAEPIVEVGTWSVFRSVGVSKMRVEAKSYSIRDGKVEGVNYRVDRVIHIQTDGTSVADIIGGGNHTQAKPTPGFQSAARWNSLLRQAGL